MEKNQEIKDKIKELKQLMVSNAKDAAWMKKQIDELCVMQRKELHETVELSIPCKEVKESIDFGACKISRTIRGYLFEAKGGLQTFVELRMARVCDMINTLFTLHRKATENQIEDEEKELYETFRDAVLYVFQAPIFGSVDDRSLFSIAADILKAFNEYAEEHYTNAEAKDDTEQDVKENTEFEQAAEGMDILIQNEKENPIGID